jgi:hypothetical protein
MPSQSRRARTLGTFLVALLTGCSSSAAILPAADADSGPPAVVDGGDAASTADAPESGIANESGTANDSAAPPSASVTVSVLYSQSNPSDGVFTTVMPNVDAVTTFLNWADVDMGPSDASGQYQWSATDTRIALYVKAVKTVNLLVNAISYSNPDSYTPPYILNDANVQKVTCSSGTKGTYTIPIVYESPFVDAHKAFIAEVVRHFSGNTSIGYIRFGLSVGNEVYPQCGAEEAAQKGLTVAQWETQVWLPYDLEMLQYIKSLNPPMKIEAPMTPFNADPLTDPEAANAVAQGFGFGSQGLQKGDVTNYPTCQGDWCNLFEKYAPGLPGQIFELSTLDLSDPSGTCAPPACAPGQQATGPLPPLLMLGVAHHASTFELYPEDALIAFDPTNPQNAQYGAAYAAAIAAARGHP